MQGYEKAIIDISKELKITAVAKDEKATVTIDNPEKYNVVDKMYKGLLDFLSLATCLTNALKSAPS